LSNQAGGQSVGEFEMNKMILPAICALLLASGAATAATTTPPAGPAPQSAQQPAPVRPPLKFRQQLRDNLSKAGLTDIKIAPEEYVVHAKDKDGNSVVMMVTPNSFLEMTDVKDANPNDKSPAGAKNSEPGTASQASPAGQ
jgi:hypothetical protein